MAVSLNIPIVTRFLILSLKWPLIAQFGAFIASHLSDVPFFLFSRFFSCHTFLYDHNEPSVSTRSSILPPALPCDVSNENRIICKNSFLQMIMVDRKLQKLVKASGSYGKNLRYSFHDESSAR